MQTIISIPNKTGFMKRSAIALIFVIAFVILCGCTQSQPAAPPQPVMTAVPATPEPTETPAAPEITTAAPVVTVTVIRHVEVQKPWKDSDLRIAFRAPSSWEVTTWQVDLPEGSQGMEYKTQLVPGDVFYIMTFPISRNQDQDYRNIFRMWAPAPEESTVTINSIVFDRFESTKEGKTQVAYVARKSSANDLGYSSVIYFVADSAKQFEKDDFEDVARSFAYLNKDTADTEPGNEIPRIR